MTNWVEYKDPSTGKPYYHNSVSGETLWEKPPELLASESNASDIWKEIFDANQNRPYYVNNQTGQTQWEKPAGYLTPADKLQKRLGTWESQSLAQDEIDGMVSDEKLLTGTVWDDPTEGKLPHNLGVLFAPSGMQLVAGESQEAEHWKGMMLVEYDDLEGWEVETGDDDQADLVRIKLMEVGEFSLEVDDGELFSSVLGYVIPDDMNSYKQEGDAGAEVACTNSGGGASAPGGGEETDAETMRMIEMLMTMDEDEHMVKQETFTEMGGVGAMIAPSPGPPGGDGGGSEGGGGDGEMCAATLALMQSLMDDDADDMAAKAFQEEEHSNDPDDSDDEEVHNLHEGLPPRPPPQREPSRPKSPCEDTKALLEKMAEDDAAHAKMLQSMMNEESDESESESDPDSPHLKPRKLKTAEEGGRFNHMRGGRMDSKRRIREGRMSLESAREALNATKSRRGMLLHDTASHVNLADCVEIGFLGAGSFGNVTMVRNAQNPAETFALKEVGKAKTVEHRLVSFLIREKKALDKLRHPFVVHLHNTFQDPHCCYFLMEVVEGPDLHALIEKSNRFAPNFPAPGLTQKQALFFSACLLAGIDHMTQRGIMHRDLKPANCVVGPDGYLKIIDYGLCTLLDPGRNERARTVCGTYYYYPPEVFARREEGYGLGVDMWCFGCILFECFCGKTPFMVKGRRLEKKEYLRRVTKAEQTGRVPATEAWPDWGPKFRKENELMLRCLKHSDQRITPKQAKVHAAFFSIDWADLETKNLPAPLRPSMLEYRKGQDKKTRRKIAIPGFSGDQNQFREF